MAANAPAGAPRMAPAMPPAVVELHYRVGHLAELLGCSDDTITRALKEWDTSGRRSGLGPSYLIAGARIVPASAVNAWLERQRVSA